MQKWGFRNTLNVRKAFYDLEPLKRFPLAFVFWFKGAAIFCKCWKAVYKVSKISENIGVLFTWATNVPLRYVQCFWHLGSHLPRKPCDPDSESLSPGIGIYHASIEAILAKALKPWTRCPTSSFMVSYLVAVSLRCKTLRIRGLRTYC